MGDEEGSGKVLRVKADVGAANVGVELEVGSGFPRALAALLPRWAARQQAKLVLTGQVLEKVRDGLALDDAEVLYASEVFGDAEARFIRRQQVAARALTAFQSREPLQLPAAPSVDAETFPPGGGDAKTTAEDWVSRYWDDAGLVSDDTLQEIYARVLASEARAPGTCSMRTLSVLRYLDRHVAEDFAKVAPLVFELAWLPFELKLLPRFGVSYSVIKNVVEAGLMSPVNSNVVQNVPRGPLAFRCGTRILSMIVDRDEAAFPVVPLTTAGRELYRIAHFETRSDYFNEAAAWLKAQCFGTNAQWAQLPHRDWEGTSENLTWSPIT